MFRKCAGCGNVATADQFADSWEVCPACGHHHPLGPDGWRKLLLDDGALDVWDEHVRTADPLEFSDGRDYLQRISAAAQRTQRTEAIEVGRGTILGHGVAYGCFVFQFMGGSMGSVVGERVTRLFERARADRLPVVLLQASGGARMQEGILSLMQMGKTVAALARYREVHRPFISLLLHPTTGGVAASVALLGDVNLAEPEALIGFAGPRVIESTLHTTLPEGFQRADFVKNHGMIDAIVSRSEMPSTIARILELLSVNGGERRQPTRPNEAS